MISSRALAEVTGATYRQIDYWTSNGIITPEGKTNPGQGNYRKFEDRWIGIVALLVKVTRHFSYGHNKPLLQKVVENYDLGFVVLEDGLKLSWPVVGEEASSSVQD